MLRTLPGNGATYRTLLAAIIVVAVAALVSLPAGSFAAVSTASTLPNSAAPNSGAATAFHTTVVKSSAFDWPELHQTPMLTGYQYNSPLSSLNASKLGVAWATNLYSSALDSPVVAYDPILGETLAYIGTESGDALAVNLANGHIVWGTWLGSNIRSSPLVTNGSVFFGTFTTPEIYRLNATTGGVDCSVVAPTPLEATPTAATPPGGVPSVYFPSLDAGPTSGPLMAINAANCKVEWKFTGYNQTAGSWDSASYAVSAGGVPMVLFGTDNPDSSIYAVNALTGKGIWHFQCYNPVGADLDVAAGVAITPPGKNGFVQGVAYASNKAGRAYALDLNNGTLIWESNFNVLAGVGGVTRSTPALDGTNVILGDPQGLVDLNATNGALFWSYKDPTHTESISSPAIAGGHGHGIVVTGDVGGELDVLSVVGATPLYSYETGGYITASPAISGGNIVIASANGFLFDFAVGGGNHAVLPTTAVLAPGQGATLVNPSGNEVVTGSATDSTGVVAVNVAIQSSGPGGPWWDAASGTWTSGPAENFATLATPGGLSTTWSFSYPVAAAGGTFDVIANAVSSSGQIDLNGSQVSFAIGYSTSGPHLEVSPNYVAPGGNVTVVGGGFGRSVTVHVDLLGKSLATITSSTNGSLRSTKIVIPVKSLVGLTSLTAVGPKSSLQSSAALTIGDSWQQLGYDPGHSGYEPNDNTLALLIFPGGNNWVKLAWHFYAGVAINASPAIVNGVAYVADTAGQLFAVDIHNGGLLWTFTLASGAPIDGSPAVDPGLGLVLFGANDGTVDAVYVSNGTLAWSTTVGGNLSAPVVANGFVYVSSSTGTVDRLREASGAVAWSVSMASSVPSAPALNTSAAVLVVGETNGDVVGLNSTNGATLWTRTTGGPVTASAVVWGGTVYIGSGDGKVYALNQLTGSVRWTYSTGAAVQDTGGLVLKSTGNAISLIIGSDNGNVYVLDASTGKLTFNLSAGSPIVGVSVALNAAVFETASGIIGSTRTNVVNYGWHYHTGGSLVTSPSIVDGTIYVCAGDGDLYAFNSNGQPPI